MSDAADREIRLAFWKIHILHHAASQDVYGLWILEELAAHGHRLSPGTIYPILARMERNGWLRSTSEGSGKARRNYRITPAGRRLLAELSEQLVELYQEVALGKHPTKRPRRPRKPRS